MSATVLRVEPFIQPEVCALCRRPYLGHPRGCPNHGHKGACQPTAPEAMDVNVTETLKSVGVQLEWPPVNLVRQYDFKTDRTTICDIDFFER